jgi:hypothetical protein
MFVYCTWDCPGCGEELFGMAEGKITALELSPSAGSVDAPADCYLVSQSRKAPARKTARRKTTAKTKPRAPAKRKTATKRKTGARR